MGVNNAVAKTLDQLRVNNAHEASEHNVIGGVGSDLFFQRAVPGGAVGVVAGLHQEGGYTRRLGTFNAQTGLVGTHCRNVEGKLARCYSVEDGLKIRSGSGYHNHNSHPTSITRLTLLSKGSKRFTTHPKPKGEHKETPAGQILTGVHRAQTQQVANSIGHGQTGRYPYRYVYSPAEHSERHPAAAHPEQRCTPEPTCSAASASAGTAEHDAAASGTSGQEAAQAHRPG